MTEFTENVFRAVGPHFVNLSCVRYQPGNEEGHLFVFSGFLVDAGGLLFFLTAGHIIRDIREALDNGAKFDVWRFDDSTAHSGEQMPAIPYDFDPERWLTIENEDIGLDYAALPLQDIYCQLLDAGGARPIGKVAWGDHLQEHDHWALIGIPSETVEYDKETRITGKVVLLPLEPAETPQEAGGKSENQFYARLTSMGNVQDIDGLSGGPIFSLKKTEEGWRYCLIGVQSGWYRKIRTTSACPITSLLVELEKLVESLRERTI
jgi:hypothetical protein